MFGKPEWFTYRLGGWGVRPRTWQGYVYIAGYTALNALALVLPIPEKAKLWAIGGMLALLAVDVLHIMSRMGEHHDERERLHQLIIERNCSFAAVAALVGVLGLQIYQHHGWQGDGWPFDPWVLGVLAIMAATKLISTLYVRRQL